jgi:hypothetical protein
VLEKLWENLTIINNIYKSITVCEQYVGWWGREKRGGAEDCKFLVQSVTSGIQELHHQLWDASFIVGRARGSIYLSTGKSQASRNS